MFKKAAQVLFQEAIFIPGCILLITILGLLPVFIELTQFTPPDRIFTFAHNYMADYYQYLSWMKDGADGKILITSRFSADLFPRQPVYLFYSVWGWLWSQSGGSLYLGYTFIRIIFSISKLLVIYLLIAQIFNKTNWRKFIFALVLFLPAFYHLSPLSLWLDRISSVDVLQRTFFIPHDLATACLLMLGSMFLSKFIEQNSNFQFSIFNQFSISNSKYLIYTGLCFFLASITNPSHLLIFYLFIGAGLAGYLLQNRTAFKTIFTAGFVSLAAGLPLILYYQHLFATVQPFAWMFEQQKGMLLNISFWQYLVSLGPVVIFFPFGIINFIRQKSLLSKIILGWAIIPFALYPFLGGLIPISQERIFEMSHFIPLGILGGAGIGEIWKKIIEVKWIMDNGQWIKGIKTIAIIILIAFCLPYYYVAERFQIDMFTPSYFNFYIPKSTVAAYQWLDRNTPDESVVATSYFSGNMLPAWSHNRVVHGHDFVTYQSGQRLAEAKALFDLATPVEQIRMILNQERVSYLLFTPETPRFETTNLSLLNDLKVVYKNEGNVVLEYKKMDN